MIVVDAFEKEELLLLSQTLKGLAVRFEHLSVHPGSNKAGISARLFTVAEMLDEEAKE